MNNAAIQTGSIVYTKNLPQVCASHIGVVVSRDMYMAEVAWTLRNGFRETEVTTVVHLKDISTERC